MTYEREGQIIERFVRSIGWPVRPGGIATQLGEPATSQHALLGELRAFQTGYGRFTLTRRDHVCLFEAPALHARDLPVDESEAEQLAVAFVRAVIPELSSRFVRRAVQHVPPSFNFGWVQRPVGDETSIYPNMIDARVDARVGAVTRYSQSDLPFVRTTPPAISEPEARARILELSGGEGIVDELSLSEDPRDRASRSETIWYGVVLREGGPYGIEREEVIIQADSGERYYFEGEQPAPH
jgi:hypothetical protein